MQKAFNAYVLLEDFIILHKLLIHQGYTLDGYLFPSLDLFFTSLSGPIFGMCSNHLPKDVCLTHQKLGANRQCPSFSSWHADVLMVNLRVLCMINIIRVLENNHRINTRSISRVQESLKTPTKIIKKDSKFFIPSKHSGQSLEVLLHCHQAKDLSPPRWRYEMRQLASLSPHPNL